MKRVVKKIEDPLRVPCTVLLIGVLGKHVAGLRDGTRDALKRIPKNGLPVRVFEIRYRHAGTIQHAIEQIAGSAPDVVYIGSDEFTPLQIRMQVGAISRVCRAAGSDPSIVLCEGMKELLPHFAEAGAKATDQSLAWGIHAHFSAERLASAAA